MRNIRQYEIAVEIYRQGSISKAAKTMHISQPTISKLLHKLEDDLQVELFDRTCMPIKLTNAGKYFIETAQQIVDLNRQIDKQIGEIKNTANFVCIGMSPSRASFSLASFVKAYKTRFPEGKILIKEGSTVQLNEMLLRGEADLILSLSNDSTKAFTSIPLFEEKGLLAVPEKMNGMTADEILHTQPFITLSSGMRMWEIIAAIMSRLNRPMPEIECQSVESALSLVEAGLGAMIVPSYVVGRYREENRKVHFLKLPEHYYKNFPNELNRKVCLFYRPDQYLSLPARNFILACQDLSE